MPHILVIDDDEIFRSTLDRLLQQEGYFVRSAPNGQVGLELHSERPADLILVDLFMPNKAGLETIIDLKRTSPNTPIIAMSGGVLNTEPHSWLGMAKQLGAIHTLAKPIDCEQMLNCIEQTLGSK